MTKIDKHAYQLAQNWPFFGANTLYISVCMQSNANLGSSCPIELLVCVSAGWFGRLMSDQMFGHLACTQTSTLRHVAVNDCFISLRQHWVVTTWGSYCVRVCVCANHWEGGIKQLWSKDGKREVPDLVWQMDGLTVSFFKPPSFNFPFLSDLCLFCRTEIFSVSLFKQFTDEFGHVDIIRSEATLKESKLNLIGNRWVWTFSKFDIDFRF